MIIKGIKQKGLRNARDLSEIPSSFGMIKPKRIIRSSRLDKMKADKRNSFLEKYDVKTIIDLRTNVEVLEGNGINYGPNIKYYHIPILDHAFWGITHEKKMSKVMKRESKSLSKDFDTTKYMVSMYENMLYNEYSISKIKEVFEIFINNENGTILFHCSAGKDRTGVLALLILTILGACEDDIVNDYIISNKFNIGYNLKRKIGLQILLPGPNKFKALLIAMMTAKKEYIMGLIDSVKNKYGSVINYIKQVLLITDEKIDILRNKFLVKA